jgi:uncharacterized membrane protein HdeD (DUF308 family)
MKTILNAAAVLLFFVGLVWFFQGIGILPGSFMTGDRRWAVAGAVSAVMGIALFLYARSRA